MSRSAVNAHTLPDNGNIDIGNSPDIGKIIEFCRTAAIAINASGGIDAEVTEGALAIVDSTAGCLTAGANGATNPVLKIDASTASVATGVSVKGAAAAAGVAVTVISSGTNESLTIDAKGTGTLTLQNTATGDIALNDDVTGTGKIAITTADAAALSIGRQGATNPAILVNASAATSTTGISIASAAANGHVAIAATSDQTNEQLSIDAKGSDIIYLSETSTGGVRVDQAFGLGVTPAAVQGAYTQTYSTADRTVSNPTCTTMGDLVATQNTGWGAAAEADFDKITTAVDQLIADNLDLRQAVTAIIDDLQVFGLAG